MDHIDVPTLTIGIDVNTIEEVVAPRSLKEMIKTPIAKWWIKSMSAEISALEEKDTWKLVKRPIDVKVIDTRWVYKVKRSTDNSTVKLKSRLVARGFEQEYGVNYFDTYAPVVKNSSVRLLMSIAVQKRWKVEQIDIRNAYVNSAIDTDLYIEQPEGFIWEDKKKFVLKLKKSLYGLKQSGNVWNKCINEVLTNILGFRRLKSDPCIYVLNSGDSIVVIAIYVDDILIYSACEDQIKMIKDKIKTQFEIDDIGECKRVIGLNVIRGEDTMTLHQIPLIEELLDETGMKGCRISPVPIRTSERLLNCKSPGKGKECGQVCGKTYRRIVGKINYLASTTRPDLTYTVSYISQFCNCPHQEHMDVVMGVLRYLAGTKEVGIRYTRGNENVLRGYVDADYAQCPIDRHSYTGFIMNFGGPVSWESKKQSTVTLSSCEAEYVALTSAAKELLFMKNILSELDLRDIYRNNAITLMCDNEGAAALAENNGYSPRTKHVDIKYHFIRELVEKQVITLKHIGSTDNVADIFTKPLGRILHNRIKEFIVVNLGSYN